MRANTMLRQIMIKLYTAVRAGSISLFGLLVGCAPPFAAARNDAISGIVVEDAGPEGDAVRWRVSGQIEPTRIADYFSETPLKSMRLVISLPGSQSPVKPVIEDAMIASAMSPSWHIQGQWRIEFSGFIYCRDGDAVAKQSQGDAVLGCEDVYGKLADLRLEVNHVFGRRHVASGQFRMPDAPSASR